MFYQFPNEIIILQLRLIKKRLIEPVRLSWHHGFVTFLKKIALSYEKVADPWSRKSILIVVAPDAVLSKNGFRPEPNARAEK